MNNETIDIIIADKAKGELKEFILQIQEADKEFLKFAGDINQFNKQASTSKLPKDLSLTAEQAERLNKEFAEQSKKIADLEAKIKKLSETRKRANKLTQEEITNNGILRRNATQYAKANSALSTSYEKLSAKLNIMKRRYKDLSVNQLSGNKLTKAQVRELKRLELQIRKTDTALKRVDRSVGESFRNVGNYRSAWKGLGNVVRASIAAFGIYSGIQIAQSIYTDIKAIDGMNKALKQVTETQEAFNRAQQFTTQLAEEAGVERIGLTKSYTKFLASAKTTNLTLDQTENIFRQVAKAGAVMNLTTDDINGSFRALEQILSKGKVQAEEIRGQLGERLPGAFQILARSMGLTTAELSKQLELGNVISEDVLPKFADELEKTFGLDKIDKVETLTSAQNRLGNAWTSFVESVENGSGVITASLIGIFGAVSDLLKGFEILNSSMDEYNQMVSEDISNDAYKETLKGIRDEAEKTGKSVSEIAKNSLEAIKDYTNELKTDGDTMKKRLQELKEAFDDPNLKRNNTGQVVGMAAERREYGELTRSIRENAKSQGLYNGILRATVELSKENTSGLKTNNEWLVNTILSKSKEYTQDQLLLKSKEELMNILKGLNKTQKTGNEVVEGSIQYYSQLISELKKVRDATATTNSEWGAQTREIEKLEKALSQLKFQFNALQSIQREGVSAIGFDDEDFSDITDAINKAKEELDGFAEKVLSVGDNSEESTATAAEAFTFLTQQVQDTLGSVGDLTDTLFERRVSQIDDLIQKNSDYYAEVLAQEEYSEEQRSRIEAERDAKEAKLQAKKREEQRKQAIANKAFALAEIAINTALAVTSIASTGGGTRYADFGVTAGILTALAVASGAAQAAAVIAQPIPQFKDGHLAGTHEGLAMINDQNSPFYQEVVERVDGTMEVYSDRDQIISMNKGDKVHKASTSENMILNHVLENLGISMQPQPRNEGITDAQMDRMAGKVYKAMIRGQKGKSTDFDGIASALRKQNRINKI